VFKSVRLFGGFRLWRIRSFRKGKAWDRWNSRPTLSLGKRMMRLFLLLLAAACLLPAVSSAEEIVFLEDGRTIQADKTEIIGDRVRIEKPAETIDIPRSAVRSIHRVTPPTASPNVPPPAEVYRDLTPQMTDKIRREIQEGPSRPGGR
jgi:hypothetical protein